MPNDIEKNFDELDLDSVNFESKEWVYHAGGGMISHITDDLVRTNYRLPDCLNQIVKIQFDMGRKDMVNKTQKFMEVQIDL